GGGGGGEVAGVRRFDGEWVHLGAIYGSRAAGVDALRRTFPMRPSGAGGAARAIRDRAIVHIPDVLSDREYQIQDTAVTAGFRAVLGVPMLREGRAIGAITLGRSAAGAFSETQVQLLRTFADQAVIAVENVRLFTELEARNSELRVALEQQTATSDILRVISQSPTDVQPVFDAVAESAARLCEAFDASIFRVDGDRLAFVAHHGPIAQRHGEFSLPLVRGTVGGRTVLESRTVQVANLQNGDREFPDAVENARQFGFRTILSVPLLREGVAIGGIQLRPTEGQPFSERHVALLQTFAHQALIPIQNLRPFQQPPPPHPPLTHAPP